MRYIILIALLMGSALSHAQYAPQYPMPGHEAISKHDTRIVGWATHCTIQRGYLNIANPSLGYTTEGEAANAVGPSNNRVVSLGDGGEAIMEFAHPIKDGAGPDFAVFENGFILREDSTLAYLELAKVAVSSDGINYVSFPCIDLYSDSAQVSNTAAMDARLIHNLAGKYIAGQGTPFDLAELADSVGIDIMHITHVRITDVVGAMNDSFATYDSRGEQINDPYPTNFPSGGFDLESVAVLHQDGPSALLPIDKSSVRIYPNPAKEYIMLPAIAGKIKIYNSLGALIWEGLGNRKLAVTQLKNGTYYISTSRGAASFVVRR